MWAEGRNVAKKFEDEEWVEIPDSKGAKISNYGRIRRNRKILNQTNDKDGYKMVYLGSKLGRVRVHRLVATAFIPNPDNLPVVDHIDGVKDNNKWTNLRWMTVQGNTQAASEQGLLVRARKGKIIGMDIKTNECVIYNTLSDMSKDTGVDAKRLSQTVTGRTKSAGGYRAFKIANIRHKDGINDGEAISGCSILGGNYAETTNKDGVSLRITDVNEKYSEKELRELVKKLILEV